MEINNTNFVSPQQRDKKWKWLNEELQKYMRSGDLYNLGSTYYAMANFVKEEGKDNAYLVALGYKIKLRLQQEKLKEFKESEFVTRVEVLAVTGSGENNSCEECSRLNGKIFSIRAALSSNPLPIRGCTHEYGCRCVYGPACD